MRCLDLIVEVVCLFINFLKCFKEQTPNHTQERYFVNNNIQKKINKTRMRGGVGGTPDWDLYAIWKIGQRVFRK